MARTKKVATLNEEATTDKKILYGDCSILITDNKGTESLVQNQTIVSTVNGKTIINDETKIIIEDIWADLLEGSGTYKTNDKKNWFYWEFDKTTIDNDDIVIKEKFECPKPKEKYYDQLVNGEFSGDYADYWKTKIETARKNYEKEAVILKQEIIMPGTEYNLANGDHVKVEDVTVKRNDIGGMYGELGNLLSELF